MVAKVEINETNRNMNERFFFLFTCALAMPWIHSDTLIKLMFQSIKCGCSVKKKYPIAANLNKI